MVFSIQTIHRLCLKCIQYSDNTSIVVKRYSVFKYFSIQIIHQLWLKGIQYSDNTSIVVKRYSVFKYSVFRQYIKLRKIKIGVLSEYSKNLNTEYSNTEYLNTKILKKKNQNTGNVSKHCVIFILSTPNVT
jgi:hypothetical protein